AALTGSSAAQAAASGKDSIGARSTAEAMAESYGGLGDEALVISRVDVEERTGDDLETWYIGRRLVTDSETKDVVVVSWTNPMAAKWRNALPDDPGDVRLRRQLRCAGRTVEDYFDEIASAAEPTEVHDDDALPQEEPAVDTPAPEDEPRPFVPSPRDIERKVRKKPRQVDEFLLRELHRSRSGRMRDIVETIRRDQMALVTGAPEGVLVVQGGPGTGKSAVGLHRVTWLVDNGHFKAEDILVVGPHQGFLDYVGRVLPTLGTRNVTAVQLALLWPGEIRGTDSAEARLVKSDERMAAVLGRRVEAECRPDALDVVLGAPAPGQIEPAFVVAVGSTSLRLPRSEMLALLERAREGGGAYRTRRDRFRNLLVDRLLNVLVQVAPRRGRGATMRRDLERNRQVVGVVDRIWPALSPEEALRSLLHSPARLRECASGVLGDDEQAALHRTRAKSAAEEAWTLDDLVCLEELRFLITGELPQRYRHIVVDEAQDLTPMQARSLARRCPTGSMTVVGDLAQATGPHAYAGWESLGRLFADEKAWQVAELNISYRVPAQIMDFVRPLARHVAPGSPFPLAVRGADGEAVRLVPTTVMELLDATVSRVVRLVGTDDRRTPRSIAVIVPDGSEWHDRVRERVDATDDIGSAARASVFVLTASQAKGMEFDHVLVLDPTRIAEGGPAGLRQLYVALTRSTQSLTVFHTLPLPAALTGGSDEDGSGETAGEAEPQPGRLTVGDTLRVKVVSRGAGGVWKVQAVSADVAGPLHLVVRHGSASPAVGDELECWVEREEGRGYRLSASDFGRRPVFETAAARYAAALGVLAEIAEGGSDVPADAAGRLVELKALANGCLNRDRADWLTVWRLLGSPDAERLASLRDLAHSTREAARWGRAGAGLVSAPAFVAWADALAEARQVLEQGGAGGGSSLAVEAADTGDAVEAAETVETADAAERTSAETAEPDAGGDVYGSAAEGGSVPGQRSHEENELNPADSVRDEPATGPVATARRAAPSDAFMDALTSAAVADRQANTHEAVRHALKAALYWAGLEPTDSPVADVVREGPDGVVLYEVLGAGATAYADLRAGATRLQEVDHTLPRPADRRYLVLAEPPAEDWTTETLRNVFGVRLLWWTDSGWGGEDIARALGSSPQASEAGEIEELPAS
ncbi:MAG TPA: UvrD-helicase domain-containing protein, partial [Yinghuangia sp.]|nr:UvrD-helicase domain-containing protein [Yinghuangia sp.]